MMFWLQRFLPKRQKDDPAIVEMQEEIAQEAARIANDAIVISDHVNGLVKEQTELSKVFDEALQLVHKRRGIT